LGSDAASDNGSKGLTYVGVAHIPKGTPAAGGVWAGLASRRRRDIRC
jgi:hypothetical protein